MECEKVRERFSSLLENELDPAEEKIVKDHLASCSDCQKDLQQFDKTIQWLHSVKEVEVPDGFLSGINKKMEERERKTPFFPIPLRLPVQAAAMVAIVFLVFYLTKMMPGEMFQLKDAEHTKPLISTPLSAEKQVDQVLAKKKVEKDRVTAQPSPELSPPSKVTPGPSEKKKIDTALIRKEQASPAAKPSQEIVLRVSDREKTLSRFHELLQQFEGKIITAEENIFIASLPASRFQEFEKKLLDLGSPGKEDELVLRKDTRERLYVPGGVKLGEFEAQGKEPIAADTERQDHLLIRILLIQE